MSSATTPSIRRFGNDLTVRLSCHAGEFVLWIGLRSFLASDDESGWTIRDFWLTRDGDTVTITNRSPDLPTWFELHPSEVAGSAAFKMMERLEAGREPKEPIDAPTIWRIKAGDRLVWGSIDHLSELVREIIVFDECALASAASSTLDFNWPMHFVAPEEKDLSTAAAGAMRAGFKAAVNLGLPRVFAKEWSFGG
jgi:hypothetical protein